MKMTAALSGIAVIANVLVGVGGAMVLVRQRFAGRWVLNAIVDLPLAVSPVMIGLAFLLVVGRAAFSNPFGPSRMEGGLFVSRLGVGRSLRYPPVHPAGGWPRAERAGTNEEESAATLGASPWQTFWLVTLPNIRDGLSFGVTLTVSRTLGEFGAVLVLGGAIAGKTQTATTFIYTAMEERSEAGAYGMALVLALTSMALLAVLEILKRRRKGAEWASGSRTLRSGSVHSWPSTM